MKKELALIPSKYFDFNSTGLEISENTPFESWIKIGESLKSANKTLQWWIGDWLNFGERKYGEKYTQVLEAVDYENKTLRDFKWVSGAVKLSVRNDNLSFNHHRLVAKLEEKEQSKWLLKAEQEDWSTREFKTAIKRGGISEVPILKGNSKVDIKLGDFRYLIKELPDNSIDLILTDPPYPKEYLPLWSDLAREAERVLKPSGFLISYSGQSYLPQVIKSLSDHLEYYWLMGLYHSGPTSQRFDVNMWNRFKPILIYFKPPKEKQDIWIEDIIMSNKPNKDSHEWGQNSEAFIKLIEDFSKPGDTILDPMFGGGAVIEAAIKTKRNIIAYEVDEETYNLVNKRIK